jgi:uncharacterized protein (TIGR03437 family)
LSATTRTWNSADFVNGKLPVQLDGVSVSINGKEAYVYFVSPNQVDVIAAADSATGPVPVVLTNTGVPAAPVVAQLQPAAPAFFAMGKYVVATHANGDLVGPPNVLPGATPAKPGETVVVYGTGFGPTNEAADGIVVSAHAGLTALPSVTIGNTPATVTAAQRSAPGLDQISVTVPGLPSGSTGIVDLPITAKVGESNSQGGLLITLQAGN